MDAVGVRARIEPLDGALPALVWRWDAETDILSGTFRPPRRGDGPSAAVELTDEAGAVAVLDVVDGCIRGLDIVVWPEVTTVAGLAPPADAPDGCIALDPGEAELAALEITAPLAVATDPDERVFHLRVGGRREARRVRIADHLFAEVDPRGQLAGFWLTDVPPFPAGDEY